MHQDLGSPLLLGRHPSDREAQTYSSLWPMECDKRHDSLFGIYESRSNCPLFPYQAIVERI